MGKDWVGREGGREREKKERKIAKEREKGMESK